jgi:hypothetical protein
VRLFLAHISFLISHLSNMLKLPLNPVLLALLAALAVLLVAWFAPLPRLVLSEEEKAGERMPQNRAAVESARADFEKAQADYKAYVTTHDVEAALTTMEGWKASPSTVVPPVLNYLQQLAAYASAGERYFSALSHYDNELMAWTRSLGTASEALRPDTWPIVEYLKRYPPPIGEASDYTSDTSGNVNALAEGIRFGTMSDIIQYRTYGIREAGRSIEYQESLHPTYYQYLSDYDKKVQALTSNSGGNSLTSGRVTFATGINILLGLVTLIGLAALFLPRHSAQVEANE